MKKLLLIFIIILVVSSIFAFGYYSYCLIAKSRQDTDKVFTISAGEGVKLIAANLEDQGLIRSKNCFEIYVWLEDKELSMQAGNYEIKNGMTIPEIVSLFTNGETLSREREIKIIEGWTNRDIDDYTTAQGLAGKSEFFDMVKAAAPWPFSFGKPGFLEDAPEQAGLEGYLFPDTYRIFRDAKAEDMVEKMLSNFGEKLDEELRGEIKKQNKTIFEIITLASIIEKEVAKPADRAKVSGIFQKRLEIGMPLQADSTVNYVTGKDTPAISLSDRDINSPYNTYMYRGLPPGPICNPGLSAIRAAVYPEQSDYLYFLSRLDTGETIFSRTFEEHVANKAKYLK